jgi:hypothetical protein
MRPQRGRPFERPPPGGKGDCLSEIYAQLAGMLAGGENGRPRAGMSVLFGDVTAAGGGVLQVVCNGMTLRQGEIRVPQALNYQWTKDTGEAHLLRAGDRLIVLVSGDEQSYYILQKAVWQ